MYNVSVQNDYSQALIVDNQPQKPMNVIPVDGTSNFTNWGSRHWFRRMGNGKELSLLGHIRYRIENN